MYCHTGGLDCKDFYSIICQLYLEVCLLGSGFHYSTLQLPNSYDVSREAAEEEDRKLCLNREAALEAFL